MHPPARTARQPPRAARPLHLTARPHPRHTRGPMITETSLLTEIPHAIRIRNFRDHGIGATPGNKRRNRRASHTAGVACGYDFMITKEKCAYRKFFFRDHGIGRASKAGRRNRRRNRRASRTGHERPALERVVPRGEEASAGGGPRRTGWPGVATASRR